MKYDNIKPSCVDSPTDSKRYVNVEAVYLALTLCCGIDGRYHFRLPFRKGEWVYATNGVVLVRVPAWCAPWATEQTHTPEPSDQAWDRALYVEAATPWSGRSVL